MGLFSKVKKAVGGAVKTAVSNPVNPLGFGSTDFATSLFGSAIGQDLSINDMLTGGAGSMAAATERNNLRNIALARENRDWQEKMSNTAYQRQMDDMKTAGLNPMLAMQGSGASTPAGNVATTVATDPKSASIEGAQGQIAKALSLKSAASAADIASSNAKIANDNAVIKANEKKVSNAATPTLVKYASEKAAEDSSKSKILGVTRSLKETVKKNLQKTKTSPSEIKKINRRKKYGRGSGRY